MQGSVVRFALGASVLALVGCSTAIAQFPELNQAQPAQATAGGRTIQAAIKVDVCHRKGNGGYVTINVASKALPAHIGHGDHEPIAFYPDADGDGYGDSEDTVTACTAPAGYTETAPPPEPEFNENDLVSEYPQYEDATAEEEGEFDGEEL